jgi:hypothetical protein
MKIKILQVDTRGICLSTESRDLVYGPPDQMNFELIASLNKGILIQPRDPNSIARLLNLLKSKMCNMDYEFVLGNMDEWEHGGTKSVPWIKIKTLMDQMKDPKNSQFDLICFIDSDAWIRDEQLFLDFCKDFMTRPEHIAVPRDVEVNQTSFLNSGFLAVKHTKEAFHILDTIFNDPDYRTVEKKAWWEQTELSNYQKKHPTEIFVLPLNDFNTPCGRIVRHCWTKHLIEHFVVEEAIAFLTRMGMQLIQDPRYSLGPKINLFSPN